MIVRGMTLIGAFIRLRTGSAEIVEMRLHTLFDRLFVIHDWLMRHIPRAQRRNVCTEYSGLVSEMTRGSSQAKCTL